jgi:hypothetical protein
MLSALSEGEGESEIPMQGKVEEVRKRLGERKGDVNPMSRIVKRILSL